MASTEDLPALRSMSIRAFVGQLEGRRRSSRRSIPSFAVTSTPSFRFEEQETALASVADIEPRPLPTMTVLSRSTLTVDLDLKQVLQRIEGMIRAKSLSYTVNLEKACVECRTACNLSFAVYLWRNEEGQLLVELQRRNGCAILMQKIRKTLFRCIQTGQEPTTRALRRCPSNMTVSPRVKKLMEREEQQKTQIVQETMETCEEHLCSGRHDLNQLAMESLIYLTDPNSCSQSTAALVTQAILSDANGTSHLHDDFVHTLVSSAGHRRRESFKYEYTEPLPAEDGPSDRTMAIMSLRVLSNALNVAKVHADGWFDMSSLSWRSIAATLKSSLRDPVRYPQEAASAAQCIRLLEELDPRNTALFSEDELLEHLVSARRFGEAHHRMLERESLDLLHRFWAVQ